MEKASKELKDVLDSGVGEFCYSGYQFVGKSPQGVTSLCGGTTRFWPEAEPLTETTRFDIGSITKTVCTVSLLARWVQDGGSLEAPAGSWVREWTASWARLPLARFLDHSSGLHPWVPLHESWAKGDTLAGWLDRQGEGLVAGPSGEQARYSDLNFWVLGAVLERIHGTPLDEAFEREVRAPLNLQARFGPVKDAVATEYHPARGGLLEGEVFDDNCAAMGGVGPHAGLFTSAGDLLLWAEAWKQAVACGTPWLHRDVARRFVERTGTVAGSSWALGWDTKSPQGSTCGDRFSPKSFGHLGFPGTSVWVDPVQDWVAIWLTNRVHPSRLDNRIRGLRPRIHNLWARGQEGNAG